VRDRFATPFQCWILVSGEDAGRDAVYLHTPNPYASSVFPISVKHLEWGVSSLDPVFRQLLPEFALRTGCSRTLDADSRTWQTTHFVWMPGLGEPIAHE
jgi:hypothetical protein